MHQFLLCPHNQGACGRNRGGMKPPRVIFLPVKAMAKFVGSYANLPAVGMFGSDVCCDALGSSGKGAIQSERCMLHSNHRLFSTEQPAGLTGSAAGQLLLLNGAVGPHAMGSEAFVRAELQPLPRVRPRSCISFCSCSIQTYKPR